MAKSSCLQIWLGERNLIGRAEIRLLKQGGWANAVVSVVSFDDEQWVIKDFSDKAWFIRHTVGGCLIRREWQALNRLQGVGGVPTEPFRVGRFAIGYRFVAGENLAHLKSNQVVIGVDFFMALENLVKQIHQRGYVHLDLRNGKNILVSTTNQPCLLDFQAGLWINLLPQWLRKPFTAIDRSGVYKWWARFDLASLDGERRKLLVLINRCQHYLWPFNRPHQRKTIP